MLRAMPLSWIWLVPPVIVAMMDSRQRNLMMVSVENPWAAMTCMPSPAAAT
jgi:hypothetical protein